MYNIHSNSLSWYLFISRRAKDLINTPEPEKAIWEKNPSAFFGLRENGVHEELRFAFASYSLWGRLNLWNPVIKNCWRKRNMTFYFALFIFNYSKTPATHYLTKRNRFIVFIWNHISSFLLHKNTIRIFFFPMHITLFLIQLHFRKRVYIWNASILCHCMKCTTKWNSSRLSTFNRAERKVG